MRTITVVFFVALVWGCGGEQEISNVCAGDLECPPCQVDAECVIASNACHETAACVHRDVDYAVNQIGCSSALEYDVPPDSDCRCIAARCQSR